MADTNFTSGTVIASSWLNDVNDATYNLQIDGANTAARTAQDVHDEKVKTPGDYSATLSTAFSTFNTNEAVGGLLRILPGYNAITTGVLFNGQRCNIEGDGKQVSIIDFRPTVDSAAITYNDSSQSGGMYQGKVSKLGFFGGTTTTAKTAISLINCANTDVSEIGIADGTWLGDSIGLYTAGRQSLRFTFSEIACARPVVFAKNATFPTFCTDHYLLDHLELIGTSATRPCIEFEPDVMITNTELRNIAIVGGKDGIKWDESGSGGTSYMLRIAGCRFEGAINTSGIGYGLYLDGPLQSLNITDTYFGTNPGVAEREGLFLNGAQNVTLTNCWFVQGAGRTAINMTFAPGQRLTLINCYIDSAATLTLTNARVVSKTVAANRISAEWVYDDGFSSGANTSDVYHHGTAFSLNGGATVAIADNTATGLVLVTDCTVNVTGGFHLQGSSHSVADLTGLDPGGFFGPSAGHSANNVYWDGVSRYVLQNNTAGAKTYAVYRLTTIA